MYIYIYIHVQTTIHAYIHIYIYIYIYIRKGRCGAETFGIAYAEELCFA